MAKKDDKFVNECRKKIRNWYEYWSGNNKNYHYFTNFILNDQFEDRGKQFRTTGKECLQVNQLSAMANTLIGEAFRKMPAFEIVPIRTIKNIEKLKTKKIIAKELMLNYRNRKALQNASKNAAIGGFGAFEICHDYVSDTAFEQEIFIKAQKNPTMCFWDPNAQWDTKVDGEYCGYFYMMSREAFQKEYGKKIKSNNRDSYDLFLGNSISPIDGDLYWEHRDGVVICKIFLKEFKKETIYLLSNNEIMTDKEYQELVQMINDENEISLNDPNMEIIPIPEILNTRETLRTVIKGYKIAINHILEETKLPTRYLPLIYLDQQSYNNKFGEQVTLSYFQQARDPQKYANHLITQSAFLIKNYGYSVWMGTAQNVAGREDQWKNVGSLQGMMIYNPDLTGGQLFKPERIPSPELPASLTTEFQKSIESISTTVGMYESMRGMDADEISGQAIKWRVTRGLIAATPFSESINGALAMAGDIILEMIPTIYDTRRPFTTNDGKQIILNDDGNNPYQTEIKNEIVDEEMRIKILPAPPLEEQKMETVQSIERLMASNPDIAFNLLDIYIKNLDMNDKQEAINRVRALLPPEIIYAGETGELPPKQEEPEQPDPAMLVAQAALTEAEAKVKDAETKQAQAIVKSKIDEDELKLQQEEQQLRREKLEMERQEALLRHQREMQSLKIDKYDKDIKAAAEFRRAQDEDERNEIKRIESLNKFDNKNE